jgi:lipopolysaccharide export system protein LptC
MTSQDRLSGLDNTGKAGGNSIGYSKFIKSLKFILPLVALGILGLLILWPQLSKIEPTPLNRDDLAALKQAETENTLINPVFNTVDEKGRPVMITAEDARQNREEKDMITLISPKASLNDDNAVFTIEAQDGQYDQGNKRLTLENNVVIINDQGVRLETQSLTTDINNNIVQSNSAAKLTSEQGTIEGQSVIIDRNNQTTTFKGPAKAVINSQ